MMYRIWVADHKLWFGGAFLLFLVCQLVMPSVIKDCSLFGFKKGMLYNALTGP